MEEWANPADAEMKFLHEVMLFTGVAEGDQVEAHYEFENTGSRDLEIEIVSVCNCMEVDWTRGAIKPGQKGTIDVVFDTTGLAGYVYKDIDVIFKNTDREDYPLVKRVMLKGNIYKRI